MAAAPTQSDAIPIGWVNGARCHQVSLSDRGLAYGDGVFETMRYQAGRVPLWPLHLDRLLVSAQRLSIPLAQESIEQQLSLILADLAASGLAHWGALKLILTRGNAPGYGPDSEDAPNCYWLYRPCVASVEAAAQGVGLQVSPVRLARSVHLGGLKHLNRLEYVLAAQGNLAAPTHQWLLLDECDAVIETLTHNIMWLRGEDLFTPALTHSGVAGVMRQWIVQRAQAEGLNTQSGSFTLTDVLSADEVFICNSLRGIWPVTHIEHTFFKPGPKTRHWQRAIDSLWQ